MAKKQAKKKTKTSLNRDIKEALTTTRQNRLSLLTEILRFGQFIGSGFDPSIRDAEIVICFADVRGFTEYCRQLQREMQDRKIQNFLRSYVRIFVEGLMCWFVEAEVRRKHGEEDFGEYQKHIVPSTYKNLGDGMMIVWEVPSELDQVVQGRLTHEILSVSDYFVERFDHHFSNLAPAELDAYSERVESLRMGLGIAKGHAWRLDFGHSVDYAGSVINLASRMESMSRPKGVICSYDVSPWLFDSRHKEGKGVTGVIKDIPGYEPVRVWMSSSVDSKAVKGFEPDPRP